MKAHHQLIAALFALLCATPASLFAQAQGSLAARQLFDDANRERMTRGIAPLKWDAELARAAQVHAARMAQQNTLSHQFPGEPDLSARLHQVGAHFSAAAENVAEGPTAPDIHQGWMNSPGHRENLLDPEMNSLGVAVVSRGTQLFAVQDFSKSLAELSLADEEQTVAGELKQAGLSVQAGTLSARTACQSGQASPEGHRSVTVFRYTTSNLSKLPDQLEQQIRGGQYTQAAVGACTEPRNSNYSQYDLAVLLYPS